MISRLRFKKIYELVTLLILMALVTSFLCSEKKEPGFIQDLSGSLRPIFESTFQLEMLEAPEVYEGYDVPHCGVKLFLNGYRALSAGPELAGSLSINGVKVGMSFQDVQGLFRDSRLRFHIDPESGATWLLTDSDSGRRELGDEEFPCSMPFGEAPSCVGPGSFTIVHFDSSRQVERVEGYSLELDGEQINREVWTGEREQLMEAYPLFEETVEKLRMECGGATLSFHELGLLAEARGGVPNRFELRAALK